MAADYEAGRLAALLRSLSDGGHGDDACGDDAIPNDAAEAAGSTQAGPS